MIKAFNPGFTIIQPDYVTGRSGSGIIEVTVPTEQYYDGEWIYLFAEDDMEGLIPNFGSAGWYRYNAETAEFDGEWFSDTAPSQYPTWP